MPSERKPTKAEIKRFVENEVRNAAKTQLSDSTDRLQVIRDKIGCGLSLTIGDLNLDGVFIAANPKVVTALQKLGKALKPAKKKSAAKKKK